MDPALDPPPLSAQPTGIFPAADAPLPPPPAANPFPAHSVPNIHPPYAEVSYRSKPPFFPPFFERFSKLTFLDFEFRNFEFCADDYGGDSCVERAGRVEQ